MVIPCFNEPDLLSSLKSLAACQSPQKKVEVIVVINSGIHHAESIKLQNEKSLTDAKNWSVHENQSAFSFQFIHVADLPDKHAGVGLARKIGMDEAVVRFDEINQDGIIVCFDADSLCDPNYLVEIEKHFEQFPKTPGCSIYFEHPLIGDEQDSIYTGITYYELHLRYYNQALRFCQLPYAFHTVGSSMAVRSSAYQKQGGMNKRKAGEDFYFLHKIISLGNFTELNSTRVIPSPRISDRVPFGTGKAIGDYLKQQDPDYYTYHFESFQLVRKFVKTIPQLYQISVDELQEFENSSVGFESLKTFLKAEKLTDDLIEIRKNSPTETAFMKRFFVWFDAFRVLKLVHFLRDHAFPNQPVIKASQELLVDLDDDFSTTDVQEMLLHFRKLDRGNF